jgi:methyltransferase (TIGR00027 family)
MTELVIKDPFDTAHLVAYYRATESERPGALIHDPFAKALAGKRGEELMHSYPQAKDEVWAVALRTRIYDDILLRMIESEQIDTVINLAAGLDARPYRLALPESLHWIEADLPALLQYKEEQLADQQPTCTLERIPLNITDHEARKAFLTRVSENTKRTFILTEGLLIYLYTAQVVAIANDLHEQAAIHWWLTELVSSTALKKHEQSWNDIATEKAHERFAPSNGTAFFEHCGWHTAEFYPAIEAALRFNAPIRARWLLRLLTRIAPYKHGTSALQTGFVLLQRAEAHPIESTTSPATLPPH